MTIVDVMFEAFKKSKLYFRLGFWSSCLITLIAVILSFNIESNAVVGFTIFSFLLQVAVFVLRLLGEQQFNIGEQLRRINILNDGLGVKASPVELLRVIRRTGKSNFSPSPASGNYFDSKLAPGPNRLIEILLESAFWTHSLAESCFYWFLSVAIVGGSATLLVIVALLNKNLTVANGQTATVAVLTVLTFWSASDVLNIALKFRKLSKETEGICSAAEAVLKNKSQFPSEFEALSMLSDYNSALASSLPIPDWIYSRNQNSLNTLWSKRFSLI